MRWKDGRQSNNIQDMRSAAGPAMGGISILFRIIPFLFRSKMGRVLLVVGVIGYFVARMMGIDLLQLASPTPGSETQQAANQPSAQDQELVSFVSVVLASTEDTWKVMFNNMGSNYEEPVLVLFRNSVNSACGFAQAAMGPFYCPGDHKLYIDLSFYEDMKNKLGAPGDFAQAYVIAHEVGHHVQTLLGISEKINHAQQNLSEVEANRVSVKFELQADCFAGIWGRHTEQKALIESGDLEEALNAAAAIGDDKLQQQSRGVVRPENFTHGTSKQRVEWFKRGFEKGRIEDCNTFEQS
ncbi:MAG: neutral zinc metallopeptidase [Pseudomonadota bacterium]